MSNGAGGRKKNTELSTEPYKGVRDFYPEDQEVQNYIFGTMREMAQKCGYAEYNASILEPAELYRGKNAENEEIINEQTYTFTDRGEREVTLRPEMTPTVARMVAAKRRELSFPLRWYSIPNVFRYERPQRGRLREHWQLNVDLFGSESPAAEVEILAMAWGLMSKFGATKEDFEIRVSSRAFLNSLFAQLGLPEEKKRQVVHLLDRKAKITREEFAEGLEAIGVSEDAFSPKETPADVAAVLAPLHETGFDNIVFNPSVVRGFDYYTGIVFEVFDKHPENNRSLFGGGRYDNLLAIFGQEPLPAVGFGMGDVTIRDFLAVRNLLPEYVSTTNVYLAVTSATLVFEAMKLAGELRQAGITVAVDLGDKKLGDQIKAADKQRIPYVIVVGEDELKNGVFKLKELKSGEEREIKRDSLASALT